MTVYIVRGFIDSGGSATWIAGVFNCEEKARKFVKEKQETNKYRRYEIDPFGVQ